MGELVEEQSQVLVPPKLREIFTWTSMRQQLYMYNYTIVRLSVGVLKL
jgi:hypothetical protein